MESALLAAAIARLTAGATAALLAEAASREALATLLGVASSFPPHPFVIVFAALLALGASFVLEVVAIPLAAAAISSSLAMRVSPCLSACLPAIVFKLSRKGVVPSRRTY